MTLFTDRGPSLSGTKTATFRADDVKASQEVRQAYESKLNVVKAEDMPWEHSADGLIKHLVHEKLNTREMCVEAYMQFLKAGEKSGRHRHMWEEIIFVVEGSGYDLHWDVKFDCHDKMEFEWATEPQKFEWKMGDFVYIPPYCAHKHFNSDPKNEARIIVMNSRIVKPMGFDWFEQLENAEGY
jgi:quercetin dioxygenase-like cupin family protein